MTGPAGVKKLPAAAVQFDRLQRERQRPGQRGDGGQQPAQPRRPRHQHRRGAPQRALCEQQPGQAEDMVAVVVGEQDGVQLEQAFACAARGGLGALAAVQQQAAAAHLQPQRGQRALRQRLRAAAAQHCNFDHGGPPLF